MTAYAVAPTPAVVLAPRGAPAGGTQDPAVPGHFDQQLHAARQRTAPREPEPEPSPKQPDTGRPDSKPHTPNDHRSDAPPTADPPHPPTTTLAKMPAGVPTPALPVAPMVEVAEAGAAAAKTPTDATETDDHAAAALAGAMLALIGPAVAGVLQPAAAVMGSGDALGQVGKTAATDAQAMMLFPSGDAAGATAASANPAPAVMAGMLTAAKDLLPIATTAKDASSTDAASSITMSAPPTLIAPTALPVLHLQSPAGSQGFAQELGQQVAWLGGQDIKQARIRLHPEELGSLDVQVNVTHGRVDVVFSAQHPGAVTAVQQSLPQLDHMLAQHGLSLGHAEVGQHHRGDRQDHAAGAGSATLDEPGEIHTIGTTALSQIGLLDAFA
jgi:flagellar hook-length control protein FliK